MSRIDPNILISSVMSNVRQTFAAFGGDPTTLERDLKQLCRSYPNLKPSVETYIHTNGTSELLVKIEGVVPIHFRGNTYNIPVNLWIPSQYPQKEPTCYVTPTKDMIIKPGHTNVDQNGLIRFPYLQDWSARDSTLVGLCTVMSSVFSETPPVNQKPKNHRGVQMQQPPRFQSISSGRRRPSYDTVGSISNSTSNSSNTTSNTNTNSSHSTSSWTNPSAAVTVNAVTVEPSGYSNISTRSTGPTMSSRTNRGYSDTTGYTTPSHTNGLPAYGDVTSTTSSSYSSKYDTGNNTSHARSNTDTNTEKSSIARKSSISENEIQEIMKSAIQQKLNLRCKTLKEQIQIESDREDLLEKGKTEIARGVDILSNEKSRLIKGIELLNERDQILTEWVETQEKMLETQDEISPDDLLCALDTKSDQLFECAATIAAIEDVMYHLSRALQKEVIDLHTYLKQVRNLASDQFMAKALALKIEQMQREDEIRDRSGSGSSKSGGGGGSGGRSGGGSSLRQPSATNAPPSYSSVWEGKT